MLRRKKVINDYWDRLLVRKNVSTRYIPYIGNVSTVADESITTTISSSNGQNQFYLPKSYLDASDENEVFLRTYLS